MKTFIYKVKDARGRTYTAVSEAEDINSLKKHLRDHGWYVFRIYPLRQKGAFFFKRGISLDELIMFTHQLASMLDAGIPIFGVLDILWKQTDKPKLQIIISQLRNRLSQGKSISESFSEFPEVFPVLYCALLKVADAGGNLVTALRKILEYLNSEKKIVTKVKKAVTYPLLVIVFSIVITGLMLVWVVPSFQMVFSGMNAQLPLATRIVIGISNTARALLFWVALGIISLMAFIFYKIFSATPIARNTMDSLKFKIPVLGRIIYGAALFRFTRSLGILLSSGVPMIRSIEVAKATTLNARMIDLLNWVEKKIIEGAPLGTSLDEARIFPPFLVDMVSIGEESGTLVDMLERISVYFEEEFDFRLDRILALLEPLLLIIVGGMVAIVLLSIYLPIFKLWKGIYDFGPGVGLSPR